MCSFSRSFALFIHLHVRIHQRQASNIASHKFFKPLKSGPIEMRKLCGRLCCILTHSLIQSFCTIRTFSFRDKLNQHTHALALSLSPSLSLVLSPSFSIAYAFRWRHLYIMCLVFACICLFLSIDLPFVLLLFTVCNVISVHCSTYMCISVCARAIRIS